MLLLDIDDVLMDWDSNWVRNESFGFEPESWVRPDWRYFKWYNPNQLWLIRQSFPEIWWHTSWSFCNQSNRRFAHKTDFGHRKNLMADYGNMTHYSAITPIYEEGRWWKLDAFVNAVTRGTLDSHAKIVWADNELLQHRTQVEETIDRLGMVGRVRLEHPQQFWSREEIESAAAWLH